MTGPRIWCRAASCASATTACSPIASVPTSWRAAASSSATPRPWRHLPDSRTRPLAALPTRPPRHHRHPVRSAAARCASSSAAHRHRTIRHEPRAPPQPPPRRTSSHLVAHRCACRRLRRCQPPSRPAPVPPRRPATTLSVSLCTRPLGCLFVATPTPSAIEAP